MIAVFVFRNPISKERFFRRTHVTNSIRFYFLSLMLPLFSVTGYTQDLHIYYHAPNDSMSYILRYPNGRSIPVNRPIVRKGSQVVLHVNDYNNYLYQLEVKQSHRTPEQVIQSPEVMNWGFGAEKIQAIPLLNFMQGVLPPIARFNSNISAFADAGSAVSQEVNLKSRLMVQTLEDLEKTTRSINSIQVDLKNEVDEYLIQAFMLEDMNQLVFDPRLTPVQIKQLSKEYMDNMFQQAAPTGITLAQLLDKGRPSGEVNENIISYKGNINRYELSLKKAREEKKSLEAYRSYSPNELAPFLDNIEETIRKMESNLSNYQKNLQELESHAKDIENINLSKLADLRKSYLSVMENDFSSTVRHTAHSDQMELQLSFTPIDTSKTGRMKNKVVAPIPLKVYGGLQINTSIGLGLGRFIEQPMNYYIRDSTIFGNPTDAFVPQLTSLVSFFQQGRNDLSLGGSLGIGFPLNGGNGLEAVSFYFGPSLVLGRNRRIFINAGFMGGRVQQLSDGYRIGDTFNLPENFLKTQAVYKIGYYLGVSFNVLNIN